jgi:hypothetical protein
MRPGLVSGTSTGVPFGAKALGKEVAEPETATGIVPKVVASVRITRNELLSP